MAAYACTSTTSTGTSAATGDYIYYIVHTGGGTGSTTTCCSPLTSTSSVYIYVVPYLDCTGTSAVPTLVRQPIAQPQFTEEQREQLRLEAEERRRLAAEEQRQREVARERAKALLLEHLTHDQRQTFEQNGWFVVEGGKSKKQYRISPANHAGNVVEFDGEKPLHRYCAHIPQQFPSFDNALAQKLALEVDEDAFLKVANRRAA